MQISTVLHYVNIMVSGADKTNIFHGKSEDIFIKTKLRPEDILSNVDDLIWKNLKGKVHRAFGRRCFCHLHTTVMHVLTRKILKEVNLCIGYCSEKFIYVTLR